MIAVDDGNCLSVRPHAVRLFKSRRRLEAEILVLRPPPSAADGLDRTCHPTIVCHQEFDGQERLKSNFDFIKRYATAVEHVRRIVPLMPLSNVAT